MQRDGSKKDDVHDDDDKVVSNGRGESGDEDSEGGAPHKKKAKTSNAKQSLSDASSKSDSDSDSWLTSVKKPKASSTPVQRAADDTEDDDKSD